MRILGLLLLDSFRMLRAQKLFWIFLVLSAVVSLLYASIGISETEFGILFGLWSFDLSEMLGGMEMTPDVAKGLYLWLFTDVIVRYWLGLIALVLGIISCASIFPEFVARGSVDLVLSKPPSRLLLYFGKYLGSLVFVAAQVFVFCLVVFFAFGLRYGDWNLSLFWALPVVLSIFSVIYSVHVFVSVWSGSVVFALLATVGVWGVGVWGMVREPLLQDGLPDAAGWDVVGWQGIRRDADRECGDSWGDHLWGDQHCANSAAENASGSGSASPAHTGW